MKKSTIALALLAGLQLFGTAMPAFADHDGWRRGHDNWRSYNYNQNWNCNRGAYIAPNSGWRRHRWQQNRMQQRQYWSNPYRVYPQRWY